jgi:hypothetical protein
MRNAKCGYIVATRTGGVKHGATAVPAPYLSMSMMRMLKKRQPAIDALMSRAVRATCSATMA